MHEVTLSDQAMKELNRLDTLEQLTVIEPIGNLKTAELAHPREPLGRFHRGGRIYYRLRSSNYRFYFTAQGTSLHVHYLLHKNTLEDFLLRTHLLKSEQDLLEQHTKCVNYLENRTK